MSTPATANSTIHRTLSRIRAWIRLRRDTGCSNEALATEAGVDEKTIRLAQRDDWNPRAETVSQIEALIPEGWKAGDPLPEPVAEAATAAASAGRAE